MATRQSGSNDQAAAGSPVPAANRLPGSSRSTTTGRWSDAPVVTTAAGGSASAGVASVVVASVAMTCTRAHTHRGVAVPLVLPWSGPGRTRGAGAIPRSTDGRCQAVRDAGRPSFAGARSPGRPP
jgi:hypothetical protein